MNVLIIEDEPLAVKRIQSLLNEAAPDLRVVGQIDTVRGAVRWWEQLPDNMALKPDLLLMDIQLADGLSFEIFQQVAIDTPVIFTTAYDEYALKAFKVNSVDYLLKPIELDELKTAIDKFRQRQRGAMSDSLINMLETYGIKPIQYKNRFLIRQNGRFDVVDTADVLYAYADDKVIFLVTTQSRKYVIDETLDELAPKLDPKLFYRISRKYICHLSAIERIEPYFNGRLRLWLKNRPADEEIFVSRERVDGFKQWLNN